MGAGWVTKFARLVPSFHFWNAFGIDNILYPTQPSIGCDFSHLYPYMWTVFFPGGGGDVKLKKEKNGLFADVIKYKNSIRRGFPSPLLVHMYVSIRVPSPLAHVRWKSQKSCQNYSTKPYLKNNYTALRTALELDWFCKILRAFECFQSQKYKDF